MQEAKISLKYQLLLENHHRDTKVIDVSILFIKSDFLIILPYYIYISNRKFTAFYLRYI